MLTSVALILAATAPGAAQPERPLNVLVFSKTAGFRHDSIPEGHAMFREMAAQKGFTVEGTEDAGRFTSDNLAKFDVVVFMNTTGTILNAEQKLAFQRFIGSGKGFVGIHAASDTEYDWPWFGRLVGAYFASHPQIQEAEIHVEQPAHPTMKAYPHSPFRRRDEWYDFRENPRSRVRVLMSLNEATYQGGRMGGDHPITWCNEIYGGRSWYTGFGHTKETYAEPQFRQMIYDALLWAARK